LSKTIDYFFAVGSPFAYLGHDRFVAIASKHAADVNVKPIDIGKVFAVSGGLPLKQRSPQRQAYRLRELARWSAFLNRPLNPRPRHFPVAGDLPARWTIAAAEQGAGVALTLAGALMRALWAEDRDWIYYRKRKPNITSLGTALFQMQAIVQPEKQHIVEQELEIKEDEDEEGDKGGKRKLPPPSET